MVATLIRSLLRDWKRMQHTGLRGNSSENREEVNGNANNILPYIKPQDNNVHIWHVVLYDDLQELEIYCMCYFKVRNDAEPTVVMRCCTPNSCVPMNRNVCLSYLSPILSQGWLAFYAQLRSMFFECVEHRESGELMKTWNRVVCKEFGWNFPTLMDNYNVTQEGLNYVNELLANENFSMRKKRERLNQGFKFQLEGLSPQNDLLACDNGARGGSASSDDACLTRSVKRQTLQGRPLSRLNEIEDDDYRRKRQ
ncbi:HCL515Wp [Eremothecium sinecaudum]|uniref:HCL515Wp n=1 Tax=Eremothecium sinecaudum TaxID=45286 RepID=A0A120K1R9_9SACH|nr:HCL515Wp [Eremothecium sinecaudum]AMD19636.1 HCL515Wp [Eremothecium sinecaudum]